MIPFNFLFVRSILGIHVKFYSLRTICNTLWYWYWYWYRLPGLSPTPLNATPCHRGDPLSSGHVFLLLFLSNSSSPYPLEGMLAERPFSIRLVSVWAIICTLCFHLHHLLQITDTSLAIIPQMSFAYHMSVNRRLSYMSKV